MESLQLKKIRISAVVVGIIGLTATSIVQGSGGVIGGASTASTELRWVRPQIPANAAFYVVRACPICPVF